MNLLPGPQSNESNEGNEGNEVSLGGVRDTSE
jgi:hypothetical protein